MHFKFITLSVSVMIKGLRSRRPRLASKFPYFYHVRLFISTFLTCHSAIIDSCNNLCFPYLSGGTRKNIWNDTFIENNPMATIQYSQTLFPILFCLHNSFKIVNLTIIIILYDSMNMLNQLKNNKPMIWIAAR